MDIKSKINVTEYEELNKLCKKYLKKNIKIPSNIINNYKMSNKPMSEKYQIKVLKKFESWKKKILKK